MNPAIAPTAAPQLLPAASRAVAAIAVVLVTAFTVQFAQHESHNAVITSTESFVHGATPVATLPTVVIVGRRSDLA